MNAGLQSASMRLRQVVEASTRGMVNRESLAELILLAAVAGEHLLVIGPPGTAKSATVRRVAQSMGVRYFEYLLGRFTEPSELFGPVDLRRLREGVVETDVSGMLPDAEIAFLDEVFLGSTAILNTLLSILNERRFRRGHTDLQCPLRVCVGASNALPDDESLAAFADRFLLHHFLEAVPDESLETLLKGGWSLLAGSPAHGADLADLDQLSAAVRQVDLALVRPQLVAAIRVLRQNGLNLSDRRIVKAQHVIAAATVLAGRQVAGPEDLWPLFYVLPTAVSQTAARECLAPFLRVSGNPTLRSATEWASRQPLSREARLIAEAERVLQQSPTRTAIECTLREIDGNFSAESMPDRLGSLRHELIAVLSSVTVVSGESAPEEAALDVPATADVAQH